MKNNASPHNSEFQIERVVPAPDRRRTEPVAHAGSQRQRLGGWPILLYSPSSLSFSHLTRNASRLQHVHLVAPPWLARSEAAMVFLGIAPQMGHGMPSDGKPLVSRRSPSKCSSQLEHVHLLFVPRFGARRLPPRSRPHSEVAEAAAYPDWFASFFASGMGTAMRLVRHVRESLPRVPATCGALRRLAHAAGPPARGLQSRRSTQATSARGRARSSRAAPRPPAPF